MKKITKAILMQQLVDRFKLQEHVREEFVFLEEVLPVFELKSLLDDWDIRYTGALGVTAISLIKVLEAPMNERITIRDIEINQASGTFTYISIILVRNKDVVNKLRYYEWGASQSGRSVLNLAQDLVLDPGDYLEVYCDGFTTNGNLFGTFNCLIETLR